MNVDETKTNIALFHGSVKGSQTDKNFTMTHGDIEFSVLEKFDYALLGDIHKTNQGVDEPKETIIEIDEEDLQKYIENGWEIVKE